MDNLTNQVWIMARLRIVMKAGIESELPFHFSLSNMSLESESNSQNTEDSLLHFFFNWHLKLSCSDHSVPSWYCRSSSRDLSQLHTSKLVLRTRLVGYRGQGVASFLGC